MENPLEAIKQLRDTIAQMPERIEKAAVLRAKIEIDRETVSVLLSRLRDLEPDNAAYAKAQATLGL